MIFCYCGSVKEFDSVVSSNWKGITKAVSEKEARSNLAYQYKRQHGKSLSCKITLPGDLVNVN